jgi:MFS family permease
VLVNAVFFLPMTILMIRTPFTGHTRAGVVRRERVTLWDSLKVLQSLRSNRKLVAMIALAGLTAVTIGGAIAVSMPVIASGLGTDQAGLAYGVLLLANGIGAVGGGFLLEATRILRPSLRAAVISTIAFGALTMVFALSHVYAIVVLALVLGGLANLASMSITQSVVQLEAPVEQRGRIFGVYGMFSSGLRVGNGITLGVLGAAFGIPYAIAVCAALLVVGAVVMGLYARRGMNAERADTA